MINIHEKTLQDLEFATVLEQVSELCVTGLGHESVLKTSPFNNKEQVLLSLEITNELKIAFWPKIDVIPEFENGELRYKRTE